MHESIIKRLLTYKPIKLKKPLILQDESDFLFVYRGLLGRQKYKHNTVATVSIVDFYVTEVVGTPYSLPTYKMKIHKSDKSVVDVYLHHFDKKVKLLRKIIQYVDNIILLTKENNEGVSDTLLTDKHPLSYRLLQRSEFSSAFFAVEDVVCYYFSYLSTKSTYSVKGKRNIIKNLDGLEKAIGKLNKMQDVTHFILGAK